jgi:hypothetical protein
MPGGRIKRMCNFVDIINYLTTKYNLFEKYVL